MAKVRASILFETLNKIKFPFKRLSLDQKQSLNVFCYETHPKQKDRTDFFFKVEKDILGTHKYIKAEFSNLLSDKMGCR